MHFLALSTEMTSSSTQMSFAENDLAGASTDPDIDWIVVFFHKPMYTSPNHHSASSTMQTDYGPMFDKYHVDLVLFGHNHSYERTFPIKYNPSSPGSPTVVSRDTTSYTNVDGRIMMTVGLGGESLYSYDGKASYVVKQVTGKYGILYMSIEDTTIKGTLYDVSGNVLDSFTVNKDTTSPPPPPSTPYHYNPSMTLDGNDFQDIPSSSNLQLSTFSVAAWFKTSKDYTGDAFIVNKGGKGSDTAAKNNNYGIWMTSSEKIRAGFETSSGTNYEVTSANTYNDNKWHYAVATYGGSSTVRLYIDGQQVATKTTSGALPDKAGTQPLRVGANSLSLKDFFTGNIDEVRVWNRALSASEISSQYNSGTFGTSGQVAYLPFDSSTTVSTNSNNPSLPITSTSPTVVSRDTTSYTNVDGRIMMTVGLGGESLYSYDGKASYVVKQVTGKYGMLYMSIEDTTSPPPPTGNTGGLTFKKSSSNPLMLGHTEPEIVKVGSTYYMYYRADSSSGASIKYATSTNGISWTERGTVLTKSSSGWDSAEVIAPSGTTTQW